MKITKTDFVLIFIAYLIICVINFFSIIWDFIKKYKWNFLVLITWILIPLFILWDYPQVTFLFVIRFWIGIIFALLTWYGFKFIFMKDTYLNFYLQKREEKQLRKKRYCKGCYRDVTKDMWCHCGELPLTKMDTIDGVEYRKMM